MIEKSFDQIIVDRLKRSAAGMPFSDGQPISRLDQYLAQGALTSRAVKAWGGGSLYGVVNGLRTDAMLDGGRTGLLDWNMWKPGGVQEIYLTVVMSDIASGRLIVREPLNFLRCNDLPEIQMLPNLDPVGLEAVAIMVRYAVKNADVARWLDEQGVSVPDWLKPKPMIEDGSAEGWAESAPPVKKWSDELEGGKTKLRLRFDVIQIEIEGRGYPPTCIPHGGIASIKQSCEAAHPKLFNAKTSFDNAWRELVDLGKVRSYNHVAYGGKDDI